MRIGLLKNVAVMLASMLGLPASALAGSDKPLDVRYPQTESVRDERASYPLAVLRDSLERSGAAFSLRPSAERMQQARNLRELSDGTEVTVVWSVASRERDERLRRVRVPIDRGLIGWRVMLVHRGDTRLDTVRSIDDLAHFTAGQGHDWPDVSILRGNGLPVAESPTYEGLFAMLARGHIDYFPRSVTEVGKELVSYGNEGIALERNLLLVYREGLYFYVNKNNAELADAIQTGLAKSIQDGSFNTRFEQTYRSVIDQYATGRRVLNLQNRDEPDDGDDPNLWLAAPQ
jgi:hypothetical protein